MLKSTLKSEDMDKLVRFFAYFGLAPNAWTLLSIMLALAGLAMLISHHLAAGLVFFVMSGLIDMVDGAVARATGKSSTMGAFVDGIVDRYVELLLVLGIMAYLGLDASLLIPMEFWMALLIFGAVMTSFVRAYADHRGLVKDPEELKRMGGLLERGERLMILFAGMALGILDQRWLMIAVILAAALANLTALQRVVFAIRRGKSE